MHSIFSISPHSTKVEGSTETSLKSKAYYPFSSWQDNSEDITVLESLDDYPLTKLKCDKKWTFYDKVTESNYEDAKEYYKSINNLDTSKNLKVREEVVIDGYKSHILAERVAGVKPRFLSVGWFWVCSVLTLSALYRHWFDSICGHQTYTFVKEIRTVKSDCMDSIRSIGVMANKSGH